MDKVGDTYGEDDKYVKRLLDRSQYSDCYSKTYRRRLSAMQALTKSSLIPPLNQHYDGNPFEKEFSQVNNGEALDTSAENDPLDVTYVSTWPEDNADLSIRTYDVEPSDSLSCVQSLDGEAATNHLATEYRSSEQFPRDTVDADVESTSASTNPDLENRNSVTSSVAERFGPLTAEDLNLQSKLNSKFDVEFSLGKREMAMHGVDEFFGARLIEICEPKIIEYHRKSDVGTITTSSYDVTFIKDYTSYMCQELAKKANATYVKSNNDKDQKKEDVDSDSTSLEICSEFMRELDCEIKKLDLEEMSDKSASTPKVISVKKKIASATKKSEDAIDGIDNYCERKKKSPAKAKSPKNSTFNQSNSSKNRSMSKTASFLKRHTSFLFKSLLTPKMRRHKSSVEVTKAKVNYPTSTQMVIPSTSGLARSNTVAGSDSKRNSSRFQDQRLKTADMNDTLTSEMECFMTDALENCQHTSTMTDASADCKKKNYTVLSDIGLYTERKTTRMTKEPQSEPPKNSGTTNKTLSVYKTLTQKIRDKFRRYDRNDLNSDVLSTLILQNNLPSDLSPEIRETILKLQEKVVVQDTLIYQTSKALKLCELMREFSASPERVEYERILLLASLTKNALLREIDRLLDQEKSANNEGYAFTERGEVTLKDMRLQLRDDVLRREHQLGDIVEWFVVVIIQGVNIWATKAIACPISGQHIYFPGDHVISGLTPDFRLTMKVFSLKMQQQELFNHDAKYHISRNCPGTSANKSKPLKLKAISPKQYKVKLTGLKETSFTFCGSVDLMLYDLKLLAPWPLSSVVPNTVLHGSIDLNLSCKLELSIFHAGFLTHCEEMTGSHSWNRRWCILEGHALLFWNYPRDQENNTPTYMIDLVDCMASSINLIDRSQCPRPKTLLLETRSKANEKDHFIVDGKPAAQVHRHLLSFDNSTELAEWHSKLNNVVSALSDWNIIHAARTP